VQEPFADQPGSSFVFEVNGVRVFCGGSNWIPADNFFTEIEPERYTKWVELMVSRWSSSRPLRIRLTEQIRGNQNMLRVWGGGRYEAEELYK
jgi:beta-mannosidase